MTARIALVVVVCCFAAAMQAQPQPNPAAADGVVIIPTLVPPPVDRPEPTLTKPIAVAERPFEGHDNPAGPYGEVILDGSGTPWPLTVSGVLLRATNPGLPDVGVKLGALTGTFSVFDPSNTRLFSVKANGDVHVGPISAPARFGVAETRDGGSAAFLFHEALIEANSGQQDFGTQNIGVQRVSSGAVAEGSVIGTYSAGLKAGAGTAYRPIAVHAFAGISNETDSGGTLSNGVGVMVDVAKASGVVTNGFGVFINDLMATNGWGIHQEGADDRNFSRGNVGIGIAPAYPLHVNGNGRITGNLIVDGNIGAKFQDVAEWVPSTQDLAPGTVAVLDPSVSNHVIASSRSYDATVAGVVSEQPGINLGEAGDAKEQIATTGLVKVRVDASRAAVRIGDLLVTGDRPGTAMKSQPVAVGGTTMRSPGTIIGKALEALADGRARSSCCCQCSDVAPAFTNETSLRTRPFSSEI